MKPPPGSGNRPFIHLVILILAMTSSMQGFAGNDLIRDTAALLDLRRGIDKIYNYEFEEAGKTLEMLDSRYPEHPITPFYRGLIYYWKYYPLIHEGPGAGEFETVMEQAYRRADSLKEAGNHEHTPSLIEGVFFELMARSFIVMYHADNGRSSKAISHLGPIYRDIIKGFELQDEFKEFLFITGLYNYYREAFPEAYPVYKPALVFFRRGDKEKGLDMLQNAAFNTDFMKVEAALFLSLIHINFENDPDSALWYAEYLHRSYPGNGFFHSKYTEMLLINERYDTALAEISKMEGLDSFNRMKAAIFRGIYEEKNRQNYESARRHYLRGIELAEPYGERANYSKAYAYIGLHRYYDRKDNAKKSKEYYKKARNATGYDYVFEK